MRTIFAYLALVLALSSPVQAQDPPKDAGAILLEIPDGRDGFVELARELALAGYVVESSDRDVGSLVTTGREDGGGAWRLSVMVIGAEALVFVDARFSGRTVAGLNAVSRGADGGNPWRRMTGDSERWFSKGVDFATALGWPVSYR